MLEEGFNGGRCFGELPFADSIGFRQHSKAALDSEQTADGKMLFRLRLHFFFGRNDEHYAIDSARACEHVADESLVSRNVDKTESNWFAVLGFRLHGSKAEIDADSAAFFFG